MIGLPEKVKNAISSLGKLPGVGEKSALRMVTTLTHWRKEELFVFARSVSELSSLKDCESCGMWTDDQVCVICSDSMRCESGVVCVVEQVSDLLAIEKSSQFKGRFVVLGGVLNPLLGIGPDQLRIKLITGLISQGKVETIILALNPSVEGDATCSYIKHVLPDHVVVERIGFGMPIGGSLEYLDSMTIGKALENRKSF